MLFGNDAGDLMNMAKDGAMDLVQGQVKSVKVLGIGCAKCLQLEENVKKALEKVGLNINIEHVTDETEIAKYGVMSTPGLVVNEKVLSVGKVLDVEQILALFTK